MQNYLKKKKIKNEKINEKKSPRGNQKNPRIIV